MKKRADRKEITKVKLVREKKIVGWRSGGVFQSMVCSQLRRWNTLKSDTHDKTNQCYACTWSTGTASGGVTAEPRQRNATQEGKLNADALTCPGPSFLQTLTLVPVLHPGIFQFQLLSVHHVGPKMTIDCGAAAFVIRLGWT